MHLKPAHKYSDLATFDQASFDQWIIKQQVIGFSQTPITLKSGKQSYWYINWRTPTSDAFLLQEIAQFILQFTKSQQLEVNTFLGVPEGATKLAIATQLQWAQLQGKHSSSHYPLAMLRKQPKQHGQMQDRYFIGAPQGKVILLEDVTTSGQSMVETLQQLQQLEIEVSACICLSDRSPIQLPQQATHINPSNAAHPQTHTQVELLMQQHNIPYYAMSRAHQLLALACKTQHLTADMLQAINHDLHCNLQPQI